MQVDDAPDIDVAMPMYNLIEYSENCSKTSGFYGNNSEMNHLLTLVVVILLTLM